MFFLKKRSPQVRKRALIIGATNAGKSTLLAALSAASLAPRRFGVKIVPLNEPMQVVADSAREAFEIGEFSVNATSAITEYQFRLESRITDFWSTIVEGDYRNTVFSVVDGPGGVMIPDASEGFGSEGFGSGGYFEPEFRQALLEHGQKSDVLMVCLDANDHSHAASFFISLIQLLHELGEPLPFAKIVILLTKSEIYLSGIPAESKKGEPWNRAWELLTLPVIREFWSFCDPRKTDLACGFVSAFGLPDETKKTPSFKHSIPSNINHWTPLNLFDAFVYLADGGSSSLSIHRNYRLTS